MRLILSMLVLAAPAFAECPAAPDIAGREDGLFAQMSSAENELAAREVSDGLWELWVMAPDEAAQEMLDEGMARREGYNFVGAIDVLDRLVEYCPDYAEGWNQRAFVHFLRQDFEAALADLDVAIDLNPRHVGALSGKALTLVGLGRKAEAELALRAALELNPWLSERHLLDVLAGEDI